jgi:Protein of unknown function (DUF3891)
MFRSRRRDVVFTQAEHARLAGTIALCWGNESFARPRLPFDSFVQGVALHDRGYGELDSDEIGAVEPARWAAIQLDGFMQRSGDAIVDLIAALHTHRLVQGGDDPAELAVLEQMEPRLAGLHREAGVAEADAAAADAITNLCDSIAFDFCFERPDSGAVAVSPADGGAPVEIHYAVDGLGGVTLAPWPLRPAVVEGLMTGYNPEGYPAVLRRVIVPFALHPGSS